VKRIVIACDGTWNRLDAISPTNVVKAAQAVLPLDPDGPTVQIVHHLDGVGSGAGTGGWAKAWDRIVGGAFGEGIDGKLEDAYRVLVFNYAIGDEIYLFGFSRGAFLARSLAGLVRCAGIVRRGQATAIREAIDLYKRRDPLGRRPGDTARPGDPPVVGPDDAEAQAFRAARSHSAESPSIAYVGVWDTVGSLGIPDTFLLSKALNRGLGFHDLDLSSRVRAARHAVSIDERRKSFKPSLWPNLPTLNAGRTPQPYREAWFPGDHGAVGGGRAETKLSDAAAVWVLEGAREAGLALDPEAVARLEAGCDCRGALADPNPGLLTRILRLRTLDRDGPALVENVARPARQRWTLDPSYRPAPLERHRAALDRLAC